MSNIYEASKIPDLMVNSVEKRRHVRRNARWQFKGVDKNKKEISGITENISKSGMLLSVNESYHTLDKGNRVFLSFSIMYKNSLHQVKGVATIKHCAIS